MKYIKTFENIKNSPEIGDYAVVIDTDYLDEYTDTYGDMTDLKYFLERTTGKIKSKNIKDNTVVVEYEESEYFEDHLKNKYNLTDNEFYFPVESLFSVANEKITPEELKEISVIKNMNKYNL